MKKLNLAIIGQGRSGKDIHGKFYISEDNTLFQVRYVVDYDARRRRISRERYPGCETFSDYKKLFGKTDIDLVVNASYSDQHYSITKDLLEHGFNVMVEKPFAKDLYECEDLIRTAKEKGVKLAVFMQSFYADAYRKARSVIESGVLGEIKQIDITYSGFARRWDWQTLQKKVAGGVYNTGPHPIGLALGFLDFDPEAKVVYSRLGTGLTSGDSDDYAKILIAAPGKPLLDVEVSSVDAFPASTIKIQGSRGGYKSSQSKYQIKYIVEGENPERPVTEKFLQDKKGNPLYCSEKLNFHEEEGTMRGSAAFDVAVAEFYRDVYALITEDKPLPISPEMAAQVIHVIHKVHVDNPLPRLY